MKKEVRLSSEIFSEVVSEMKAEKMEGTKTGIVDWFENPYYLGIRLVPEYFYPNQIRIVKSFYGEDLNKDDIAWLELLKSENKTNWKPGEEYDTLLIIAGQRWGKSYLIAGMSLREVKDWIEPEDPWTDIPRQRGKPPIAKGAPVEIKEVATSKENARDHVFNETQQFVEMSPYFKRKFNIDKQSKRMEIEFPHNLRLMAGASSGKSIRGGTNLAVGFDEICHQIGTKSQVGGEEIWKAMRNTTVTLGGKRFIISSPLTRDDQGMVLLDQAMSGESRGTLAFHLSSFEVCPWLRTDKDILKIMDTDPEGKSELYSKDTYALQVPVDFAIAKAENIISARDDLVNTLNELQTEILSMKFVEFENKYRGTDEKSSLVIKITYEFSDEEIDLPPTDEE